MRADIYKTRKTNTFILVPSGSTLAGVPGKVISELGEPVLLNTRNLEDPSLGVDVNGIIAELLIRGFSVCQR